MTQLINQNSLTMNSLEIAELVQSRHDHTKRSIERLANQGVIEFPPMEEIKTATKPMSVYVFSGEKGKRDSIIVVAQLCPEFTARLVDRWQELENQINQPKLPQNYLEALQHLVEAEKEKQLLQAQKEELEDKLEDAQPKINFANRHELAEGEYTLRDTAKLIGMSERLFIQKLIENKFVYRSLANGRIAPYKTTLQKGLMDFKTFVINGKNGDRTANQTIITPKGMQYFQHHFSNVFAGVKNER